MTADEFRAMALALPGVEEGSSYGTPGYRVRKKFLARMKEDGETLVLRLDLDEKAFLMEADPEVFFETDHYKGWSGVLVRLERIEPQALRPLVVRRWRLMAARPRSGRSMTPADLETPDAGAVEVDARGHRCPTPTLRLRRALEQASTGQSVMLLADDPLARIDVPHFAAANGHAVLGLTVEDGVLHALVRKGG